MGARLRSRLRAWFRRREFEHGMREELRLHVEEYAEQLERGGLPRSEALRRARLELGGVETLKEDLRAARGLRVWDEVAQDARYGARVCRRSPVVTGAVVGSLALGIGAATAVFAVIQGVLLSALPYPDASRITQVWEVNASGGRMIPSDPNFADLQAQNRSFSALAQYASFEAAAIVNGAAILPRAALVSADFFTVMGVQVSAGRLFRPDELRFGTPPVAIVSEAFWRMHLPGRSPATGITIRSLDQPITIVGVMPAGFSFPANVDVWLAREQWQERPSGRTGRNAYAIARLAPGVTVDRAQLDLSTVAKHLKQQYGSNTNMADAAVVRLQDQIVGPVRPVLLMLLGAVAILVVLVSANVLNLLLVRASSRSRELALRVALGAARGRIARQLIVETGLMAAGAGVLGIVLADAGIRALRLLAADSLPRVSDVVIGWPSVAFAAGLSALLTVVVGLAAALRAAAQPSTVSLKQGFGTVRSTSSRRLRAGLIVVQVAVAFVLLTGAGLMTRSVLRLLDTDVGFATRGIIGLRLSLPPIPERPFVDAPAASDGDKARRVQLLDRLVERLGGLPSVEHVGLTASMPFDGTMTSGAFIVLADSREADALQAQVQTGGLDALSEFFNNPARAGYAGYRSASGGYFRAMGIPLVRGRLFDARDTIDSPHVAVISETLARTQWPGRDPLGLQLEFGNMDGDLRPLTVIGVVGDVRDIGINREPDPLIYTCYCQRPNLSFTAVMRSAGSSASVVPLATAALREMAPDVPTRATSIEALLGSWLQWRRFVMIALTSFALTALLLAVVGVYGAVSFGIAQQTREFGVRLALGAGPGELVVLVLRQAAFVASIGIGVGAVAALASGRVLVSLLYEVAPSDVLTYGGVAAGLLLLVLTTTFVPARRAARLQPSAALRAES